MSDREKTDSPSNPNRLQEAFEEQAGDLGLISRADLPRAHVTSQMVGIAAAGTHSLVEVERKTPLTPVGEADRKAITEVIEKFEGLHPQDFLRDWKNYATNPYVAVGESLVGTVEEDGLEDFFNRKSFKDTLEAFPPFKPRKLEVSEMRIVFIGQMRAAATYRVEEQFRNEKNKVDNCAAILVKFDDGWKVAAVTTKDKGEAR